MTATCATCGRRWDGLVECHCTVCHEQFGGVSVFDMHRVRADQRDGKCLAPADLRRRDGSPALVATITRHGPVWHRWFSHPHWLAPDA